MYTELSMKRQTDITISLPRRIRFETMIYAQISASIAAFTSNYYSDSGISKPNRQESRTSQLVGDIQKSG